MASLVCNHGGQKLTHGRKQRHRVDFERLVDHLVGQFHRGFTAHDARVVDEQTDGAKVGSRLIGCLLDGQSVGHVTLGDANVCSWNAVLLKYGLCLLQTFHVHVAQTELAPQLSELDRHEPSDAPTCASQEYVVLLQTLLKGVLAVLVHDDVRSSQ